MNDIEHRMLRGNSPEIRAIVAVLGHLKALHEETGNHDLQLSLSVLINAAGHLLAISPHTDAEIEQKVRAMRRAVAAVAAGVRRQGGSPLVHAVPTGRA
jgi:hypothetical protein